MPTTFNVISLGNFASIDPTEGNTTAENASLLVGLTFGDLWNPLWERVHTLTPGTGGFGGGTATAYDMNNTAASEGFRIDGGPNQIFDGTAIYNATLTYVNGSTATITAVLFQDTLGNLYLAPEFTANPDQTALEAGPIRSLTLTSLSGNVYSGLTGSRQTSNFMVCFTEGTLIRTPSGDRPVQTLAVGDMVTTLDHGAQPLRWIGGRTVPAVGKARPIAFEPGALARGLPSRRLMVSRQHRMLVRSKVAARMFDVPEVLISAHRLLGLPGITEETALGFVTYWHFLCDRHEIVFANDAPTETLYLGSETRKALAPQARAEIDFLFPELVAQSRAPDPARPMPVPRMQTRFSQRMLANRKQPIEAA
jgi:hypothetical protein